MDECKKLNEKWGKQLNYMLNCNIHSSCGGGTVRMSKSQCSKPCSGLSNRVDNAKPTNNQNTDYSNSPASPVKISCSFHSGSYNYDYGMLTYNECSAKTDIYWDNQLELIVPTVLPTMTEDEAQRIIDQHNQDVKWCRNSVNQQYEPLIRGCNRFGGSSAYDQCLYIYKKERQEAYDACGTIY